MQLPVPLLPRVARWGGVIVVAGIILYGSLLTVPETVVDEIHPEFLPIHYWRHMIAYLTFALALAYATDHWRLSRWRKAALVIAVAVLYGVAMEFGQSLLPYRSDFLLVDVVMNGIGASGVLAWYAVRPRLHLVPVGELLDGRFG